VGVSPGVVQIVCCDDDNLRVRQQVCNILSDDETIHGRYDLYMVLNDDKLLRITLSSFRDSRRLVLY